MHQFMLPTTRAYSPAAHRLRFAIDRFLAGKLTPMQLQSWCFAHFDQLPPLTRESERQFWQLTMRNLAVFHRCDFHRTALEQSLTVLVTAMDTTGSPCATPLTTSECWHDMARRKRQSADAAEDQAAIALGYQSCH